jgi:hypothetical protein
MAKTPEKAFYAVNPASVRKLAGGGYSRVYFGAEFCQWRLPSPSVMLKVLRAAHDRGMGFTLLTPWVTDSGIARINLLLESLSGEAVKGIEVVVNDFGVLEALRKHKALTPVLGRLLVKQKRCPRIPGIVEGLPDAGRAAYLRPGVEDSETAGFLKKYRIKRIELDSPLQGVDADLKSVGLKGSIYTPFAFVTTTRHCPASFDGETWQAFTGCRIKGCAGNIIELSHLEHKEPLIMRGNTQFTHTGEIPANIPEMGIDRIVVMEETP